MVDNILKALLDNMQDLLFLYTIGPNPKFDYVSPSAYKISGYTQEEFYNDPSLLFKLVPEDDYPLLEFIQENPQMIIKPVLIRWVKKEGKVIWTEQRYINIYNEKGKLTAIEGFVRDITEEKDTEFALRESEKKFRELFNNINDLIFLIKFSGNKSFCNIIEVNDAACRILGYLREELLNITFKKIINKENFEQIEFLKKVLLKKKQINFEFTLFDRNMKEIPVDINAKYFRIDGENVILAIARDITEHKKLEKEIIKTKKLESLSILAGGIAHDFNNMLSAILGNISLAKVSTKESNIVEILSDSEKATIRAKNLVNQLLTFSKGSAPIKRVVFIDDLIIKTVIFALRGSNVKYKFSFSKKIYPVSIDSDQISQVINNLVINAIQAMPNGGLLEVKIKNTNKEIIKRNFINFANNDFIQIVFKDTGVGISKENLSKIFDPFFSTKSNGNGLGLTSCYSIIKKHDGFITVESEEGHGTSFYIYLPAADIKLIKIEKNKKSKLFKGKARILIMDDDEDVRFVSNKLIQKLGYETTFAKDGLEAIKLFIEAKHNNFPFNLVIMDLTIPGGMGGKETIKELLKISPDVKAIVSSGYHNDPIIANYKDFGFKGFITKPYTIEDLGEEIHKVLKEK